MLYHPHIMVSNLQIVSDQFSPPSLGQKNRLMIRTRTLGCVQPTCRRWANCDFIYSTITAGYGPLYFSSNSQSKARAKRINMLRDRRKDKKSTSKTSKYPLPSILDCQPTQFEELFDSSIPKFRLKQTEELIATLNKFCLETNTAGPRSPTAKGSKTISKESQINGSAQKHPLLYPALVSLARRRSTLNRHILDCILADKNLVSSTFRLNTMSAEEVTDLEEILVATRIKTHARGGIGWKAYPKVVDEPLNQEVVRQEARHLARHLDRNLPREKIKSVSKLFTSYLEDSPTARPPHLRRTLARVLHIRAATHFHLVASEVAAFFDCSEQDSVCRDVIFKERADHWKSVRVQFVECLVNIQTTLRQELGHSSSGSAESTDDTQVMPNGDDVSNIEVVPATKPVRVFRRRAVHLAFEAMTSSDPKITQEDPDLRRMVFLDNLPVDMTEKAIFELYSRCGKISSVKIFQQRPDLDPGPLTTRALAKKRKQRLRKGKDISKWKRQRCPVYALIDFADDEGYRRATDDTLRLFGMVIEYHDVRSIPARNMTTLFVEDLQCQVGGKSLVNSFEDLLPDDWTVCLQSGQNQNALVASAEVQFPTFTDAYRAFQIIDAASIASVQWMRTPKDASEWWTRARVV